MFYLGERFSFRPKSGYHGKVDGRTELHGYIYAMVDQRFGQIRYIGSTVKNPGVRALQHHSDCRRTGPYGERLREWLDDMRLSGERPDVIVVDVVPRGVLRDAERAYIRAFAELGVDLVNIRRCPPLFSGHPDI